MEGRRVGQIGRVVLAGVVLALGLAACGGEGSGGSLYAMACATCHGPDRAGIAGQGPDLGAGSFAMEESDQWLTERITHGYRRMPPIGRVLTDGQIEIVVAHLRSEAGLAGDGTTTTTTTIGPDVVTLGERIFQVDKGCVACHGPDAGGTDVAPAIAGASKSAIAAAVDGGVPAMAAIDLTPEELEAVYQYLRSLPGTP